MYSLVQARLFLVGCASASSCYLHPFCGHFSLILICLPPQQSVILKCFMSSGGNIILETSSFISWKGCIYSFPCLNLTFLWCSPPVWCHVLAASIFGPSSVLSVIHFLLLFADVHVWSIVAELVRLCMHPPPFNPFAVDFSFFENLPLPNCILASAAMINVLQKVILSSDTHLTYISKGQCPSHFHFLDRSTTWCLFSAVHDDLRRLLILHFSHLSDLCLPDPDPLPALSPPPTFPDQQQQKFPTLKYSYWWNTGVRPSFCECLRYLWPLILWSQNPAKDGWWARWYYHEMTSAAKNLRWGCLGKMQASQNVYTCICYYHHSNGMLTMLMFAPEFELLSLECLLTAQTLVPFLLVNMIPRAYSISCLLHHCVSGSAWPIIISLSQTPWVD